uniref:Uncharacterized protein n=1 Tax=Hippocampus comes TaxID=109280 RepID=A0A3Q3E1P7_HIPCM
FHLTCVPSHRFINSRKQNICVGLLEHGFHRSFSELFLLLRLDQERREAAEINSALSLQTPLEEQHDKIKSIGLHLSRAEQAQRDGTGARPYQRLHLGAYFTAELEDLWLSLHFYHTCTDAKEDGCMRHATEGRACLAELYLQQGARAWLDSSGRPLPRRSRESLWAIYSRQSAAAAHACHHPGCKTKPFAAENKHIEGEAAYQLGLAYYSVGDFDTSEQVCALYLNTSMEICSTTEDFDGLGKAYKAVAKLCERYSPKNYIRPTFMVTACVFSLLQGYNVACDIGDVTLVQKAQVCSQYNISLHFRIFFFFFYLRSQISTSTFITVFLHKNICNSIRTCALLPPIGVVQVSLASAHTRCIVEKYSADVESTAPAALSRLLAWKVSRGLHEASDNAGVCDY